MTGKQKNSSGMADPGIYPMLYAFFDQRGRLRKDPFRVQVDASLSTHAAGVAILGLGTEVSKLTFEERQEVLEVVAKRIDGRKPLLVTIYGDTITEQIEFSKLAIQNGASAVMLQPPSHKMDELTLIDFFSKIIEAVDCPIGVQNAPEFLGFGLSNKNLIQIAKEHENFKIAKLECNAVNLASVAS